jgi:hypothetical protein
METKKLRSITLLILILTVGISCHAQRAGDQLPTIGSLRSDENRGEGRDGCANHDIVWRAGSDKYIFSSDRDGFQAFMNLDGHNVQLDNVKTTLRYIDQFFYAKAVYEYRYKKVHITVRLTSQTDYTTYIPAAITLRAGRKVRTIRGFVAPQCDAI